MTPEKPHAHAQVGYRQMTAKRTPLNRPQRRRITPAAVELFRRMQATDDSDEWVKLHDALHDELQCLPWEWPVIAAPDEVRPSYEDPANWQRAQLIYQLLAAAAR
jgi:hypothetical protein